MKLRLEREVSPLVAVAEEDEYRVSVALFSEGEMRPALSVTFALPSHRPLRGSDMWRRPCDARAASSGDLCDVVRRVYARSEKFQRLWDDAIARRA